MSQHDLSPLGLTITFHGEAVALTPGETVLAGLERHGFAVQSSCRAGVCQACLLRAIDGAPPAAAQKGLKPTQQQQGLFLACQCYPEQPLSCVAPDAARAIPVRVLARRMLGPDVVAVRFSVPEAFTFQGGQFVNLVRADGLVRSYSVASLPGDGPFFEIHVRRVGAGGMSGWIHDTLGVGDELEAQGPLGDCTYVLGEPERPLLLAGVGTGIAPLWAVVRDALRQGHTGPITVLHGGLDESRLYLVEELTALAAAHPHLHYIRCLLHGTGGGEGVVMAPIGDVARQVVAGQKHARAYLCGDAEMVTPLRKQLFLGGLSMKVIHADAFVSARSKPAVIAM